MKSVSSDSESSSDNTKLVKMISLCRIICETWKKFVSKMHTKTTRNHLTMNSWCSLSEDWVEGDMWANHFNVLCQVCWTSVGSFQTELRAKRKENKRQESDGNSEVIDLKTRKKLKTIDLSITQYIPRILCVYMFFFHRFSAFSVIFVMKKCETIRPTHRSAFNAIHFNWNKLKFVRN